MVEVTNISPDTPHRFQPPWARETRYIWAPGQTLEVPEDVASAVVSVHGGKKLIIGRPKVRSTYEDRQMISHRAE